MSYNYIYPLKNASFHGLQAPPGGSSSAVLHGCPAPPFCCVHIPSMTKIQNSASKDNLLAYKLEKKSWNKDDIYQTN